MRVEEAAAFTASGYAKLTGKLGVCVGTTGPGAVHLLNGLYDAALDGAPVVAITGLTFHDLHGTRFIQALTGVTRLPVACIQMPPSPNLTSRIRGAVRFFYGVSR